MKNKLWFKRKLYGWGWTPSSWQGWIVLLVWFIVFYFSFINIEQDGLKKTAIIFLMTAILIYICYKKGEKPRWQWGKRIED